MKVGVVGSGFVGSAAAYALVHRGVGREIVLVDRDEARARAEADDVQHAVPFAHPLEVSAGGYRDLAGCHTVILAAGVNQAPGETRIALLARNAEVFRDVVPRVLDQAPDAVLLVATNPVDVMTHLAARHAAERRIPRSRVIGSGTTLDTARFRALLGRRLGVDAQHVHAYVVGEHGDSEVLLWSSADVGGVPVGDYARSLGIALDETSRGEIDRGVRRAAYTIIKGKGATYYGIGAALARIVEVVLSGQRSILTVCTALPEAGGVKDVTVSLPHLVGGSGILARLPLDLAQDEEQALARSARTVKDAIDALPD
jgi:L-lactate dehydrogenase